jgi:lipoprotein-anchoring transpeptidase ErfK/SrfK
VLERKISSGRPYKPKNEISWNTPKGTFHIQSKMPSKHMGDGRITSDIEAYELPGVPWVCFFEPETGVATHGTYWHRNYGMTMSHGCVNMTPDDSKWIYRWTTPVAPADSWETRGYGTRVIVY